MRLLPFALLLTALPAAAAPQDSTPAAPSSAAPTAPRVQPMADSCGRPDFHQAELPKPAESQKLGELPSGDLILSVYNQVDGCMEPVIVQYGVGREPQATPAPAPEPVRPRARLWR